MKILYNPGRSQEFVSDGDKRVGSVTSGVHSDTEPPVGSGTKPQNTKNYAENLIECHKFHTVETKKIFSVAILEGDMSPLSPLPYTPVYNYYPRDAMLARVIVIATCLSVRLSVCHVLVLC